jgi:glutamine amidotransferase
MCRHLAYVGPPAGVHALVFGAPHSLCAQARAPRFQQSGDTNPDGWGIGWYEPGAETPHRYRTTTPIWDDAEAAARTAGVESAAMLGAARLASPGATIDPTGNAPFAAGPWLFSLNGFVRGFRRGVGDALRSDLSSQRRAGIEGDSDSEVLFALVLDRLDEGDSPRAALAAVVRHVTALTSGNLNLLLTDGHTVVASRFGNSLFVRRSTVASEPLDDDPAWRAVPERSYVELSADGSVLVTDPEEAS